MAGFYELLTEFNFVSVVVRLFLAVVMGGIIGLERGIKGRAAGMRTYMLVCIGAAMVMVTSQYLAIDDASLDVTRMGAQVVSGIGFLGAGTIIITKERQVRGLTTAAGLWASAAMGLAIGVGFYMGAFVGMFCIIFTTSIMHRFDNLVTSRSRAISLYLELKEAAYIPRLLNDIRMGGTKVTYMEVVKSKYSHEDSTALLLSLLMPGKRLHYEVVADFIAIDYVRFAEEV